MTRSFLLLISLWIATLAAGQTADSYRIIHVYPHDAQAFTQGLVYVDGHLYESTGLSGRSSLRMEDLDAGKVLQRSDLSTEYFAEGLTNWGSTLVQLTWQSHTAFVTTDSASGCCALFTTRAKAGASLKTESIWC